MRAIPQSACSDNANSDDIKGIVYYGSSTSTPSTSAYDFVDGCDDETSNLTPYLSKTAGSDSLNMQESATVGFNDDNLFRWYLNSTTMVVNWSDPTLLQIINNDTTYAASNAVLELPNANEWVYIVIETTLGVTHPIHLHGHDFFILAQGTGTYSSASLNLANPPRRDTAMLPASGYLALAFETNNPGAWLMHCHIGWHTVEGFALQFIEQYDEIAAITNATALKSTCDDWSAFQTEKSIVQEDSGI